MPTRLSHCSCILVFADHQPGFEHLSLRIDCYLDMPRWDLAALAAGRCELAQTARISSHWRQSAGRMYSTEGFGVASALACVYMMQQVRSNVQQNALLLQLL